MPRNVLSSYKDSSKTRYCAMGAASLLGDPNSSPSICDLKAVRYHLYSIWLFTFSDLKTIVIPKTAFGLCTAAAFSVLSNNSNFQSEWLPWLLNRLPRTAFWCWINLLPFAIENQRQPSSIEEDAFNKPWRPMPSKRMHPSSAKRLSLILYCITIATSLKLGAFKQCLTLLVGGESVASTSSWVNAPVLMLPGYWYNNGGGADCSCIVRNLANAAGYISYASGATEVALGSSIFNVRGSLAPWFGVIAAVVFTTVQSQDMYDQAGDSERGRNTVPLVIGDAWARWSIAVPVLIWSWACPRFWVPSVTGYVLPVVLGSIVGVRILSKRTVGDDRTTFLVWNIWMTSIYAIPLLNQLHGSEAQ